MIGFSSNSLLPLLLAKVTFIAVIPDYENNTELNDVHENRITEVISVTNISKFDYDIARSVVQYKYPTFRPNQLFIRLVLLGVGYW